MKTSEKVAIEQATKELNNILVLAVESLHVSGFEELASRVVEKNTQLKEIVKELIEAK
jgi:hypothetical protein